MKRQENQNSWLIDMLNSKGIQIAEAETEFKRSLEQLSEGQRQFGFRTEAMFAYVAGAMGRCILIKQEDCGQWYVSQDSFSIPDYRVFLRSGEVFLVEVKNETKKKITFKKDYLNRLQAYSDLNQLPLKIAIYWQTAGFWTFNDLSNFEERNGKWFMSIDTAMAKSEISVLGDEMIGTRPSLSIRLICDPEKTSEIDDEGKCQICFSDVEHYCHGKLITNEMEKKIAFQLMLSSHWNEEEHIEIDGNKVSWLEYSFIPEHYDPEQGFAMIGTLSSII